ncbi:MAG: TRAP transporter small permease [Sulfuritalea sp.]|nr:TRAP transporter small permease [Sulfuritalea sp.]
MSEPLWQHLLAPKDPCGRVLFHLCRGFAIVGGLVLMMITVMSVASTASRAVTGRPLLGDFELVQLGCAVAVAAFLPWGQMRRSHVLVDFFTIGVTLNTRRVLDGIGALLVAGCAALIAWRMMIGTVDLRNSSETSMLLGVPIWYAYALMVPSFMLLTLAGLHTAWSEFRGVRQP